MNKELLEKIKRAAEKDRKKRKDPRYLRTMGFMTRKGLLKTNREFRKYQKGKLLVKDALWAGQNLEPRILEVLPATIARLPKEVLLDGAPNTLLKAAKAVKNQFKNGPDFMGIPFQKYAYWANIEIGDRRTKPLNEIKQMRSFRLNPKAIKKLEEKMAKSGMSGSEVLEEFLLGG